MASVADLCVKVVARGAACLIGDTAAPASPTPARVISLAAFRRRGLAIDQVLSVGRFVPVADQCRARSAATGSLLSSS